MNSMGVFTVGSIMYVACEAKVSSHFAYIWYSLFAYYRVQLLLCLQFCVTSPTYLIIRFLHVHILNHLTYSTEHVLLKHVSQTNIYSLTCRNKYVVSFSHGTTLMYQNKFCHSLMVQPLTHRKTILELNLVVKSTESMNRQKDTSRRWTDTCRLNRSKSAPKIHRLLWFLLPMLLPLQMV